jgi:hypothetical protein
VFHFRTCLGRFCFNDAGTLVPGVSPKSNIWLEKAIFPVYAWAGAEAKKKAPTAGTQYALRNTGPSSGT